MKRDTNNHGRMVKQKSGLNRVILDQSWGLFKTFLEYKQFWPGAQMLFVDPKYTSQTSPMCYHRNKGNRQTQAEFKCVQCGHRLIACGTGVRENVNI
ncbi:MAG: transposase [gamma proteobacterium symbiont of Taylorina sp.]|nr:transposase [gamma proteobacterium symbiont of Taylorina sp.]